MQEEKGMTEDEMVGWHHRLDGHEFEQTLGDGVPGRWQVPVFLLTFLKGFLLPVRTGKS